MYSLPWISGRPSELGLVGLLWYWPKEWQGVRRARVFDRAGGELVIEGENLDREGTFRETFSAISYAGQEGAPSWASSLDLPTPGCWRLRLSCGKLRAFVDIRAVRVAL